MNYEFLNYEGSFKERLDNYFACNGRFKEILNDDFKLDLNQEVLLKGKQALLSLVGSKVLIIGDFDCDGICATTIMKSLLNYLKIENNYYIPSRFLEGYGLTIEQVQKAIKFGFDAIITVDNGIVASDAIKMARDANIKTLIIDHHEYEVLPPADYILHGSLLKDGYHKACASGLVYLLTATFKNDDLLKTYAGIATYADMVEVFGFNRYLIKEAYRILNEGNIKTINALSGKKQNYTYDDLSFLIASKINSISRIKVANVNTVVGYLLCEDDEIMLQEANKICQINNLRKDLSEVMTQKALHLVDDRPFQVLYDKNFDEGLCGLVANKISRQLQKPCIVLADGAEGVKGSGRGTENFNILASLKKHEALLTRLGGHKQAVGLSLEKADVNNLRVALNQDVLEFEALSKRCIKLSSEDLNLANLAILKALQPFGTGFEEPLFYLDDLELNSRYLIKQRFTKFRFNDGLEGISFNSEDYYRQFTRVVTYLKDDSYRKNKISMQIQELL